MASQESHDKSADAVEADRSTPSTDKPVGKPSEPYTIYTIREKYFLAILVGFTGLFSPLSANIYFPAIPTLASAFNVSVELINVTVTVYMVLQGVSPMVFGTLGDYIGRKPLFVTCLIILSGSCVGLALVPTDKYWLLVFLRCVQASGSASTVALGAGVIGDVSTPEDRGGLFGVYNAPTLIAPAFAPVIGGALVTGLSWRAIFWFLCIASAVSAVIVILILPETLRSLVGNGSIKPSPIYRAVIPIVGRKKLPPLDPSLRPPHKKFRNPLGLFLHLDMDILLLSSGVLYAVFYGVTASMSVLFADIYPFLNSLELGLCYLTIGGGAAVGTMTSGRILDIEFRRYKRRLIAQMKEDGEKEVNEDEIARSDEFPLEKARLHHMPLILVIFIAFVIGFGWALDRRVHLAVPLVMLFFLGVFGVSFFMVCQTALIDLAPQMSSSITACNNIVRCALGAILVATIDFSFRGIGVGWTYMALAAACAANIPLIYLVMNIGPGCRARRRRQS